MTMTSMQNIKHCWVVVNIETGEHCIKDAEAAVVTFNKLNPTVSCAISAGHYPFLVKLNPNAKYEHAKLRMFPSDLHCVKPSYCVNLPTTDRASYFQLSQSLPCAVICLYVLGVDLVDKNPCQFRDVVLDQYLHPVHQNDSTNFISESFPATLSDHAPK